MLKQPLKDWISGISFTNDGLNSSNLVQNVLRFATIWTVLMAFTTASESKKLVLHLVHNHEPPQLEPFPLNLRFRTKGFRLRLIPYFLLFYGLYLLTTQRGERNIILIDLCNYIMGTIKQLTSFCRYYLGYKLFI